MAQNFDFSHAAFYFGNGTYPANVDEDRVSELASHFHEGEIEAYMGSFSDDVMEQANMYADRSGIENITVEKGSGLSVNILENGEQLAAYQIDVMVDEGHEDDLLPNGEPASRLAEYDWEAFDKLEQLVQKQDAQFGNDVDTIQETESGLKQ